MITSLHEELETSKEKQSKMEKEINDVDFNAKKSLEELQDKIQVERCVMEMVSWVSEQLNNQMSAERILGVQKHMQQQVKKKIGKVKDSIPPPQAPQPIQEPVRQEEPPKGESLSLPSKKKDLTEGKKPLQGEGRPK